MLLAKDFVFWCDGSAGYALLQPAQVVFQRDRVVLVTSTLTAHELSAVTRDGQSVSGAAEIVYHDLREEGKAV